MPQLMTFQVKDFDDDETVEGAGYRIGDRYVLTGAHVYFEWDRGGTALTDIRAPNGLTDFVDYRGYRDAYRARVEAEVGAGSPPENEVIESHPSLLPLDMLVFRASNSNLTSNNRGLVYFLDAGDLGNITATLGVSAQVFRDSYYSTHTTAFGVEAVFPGSGTFYYGKSGISGDSGGAYILRHDGREYVIGSVVSNVTFNGNLIGRGTFFKQNEWTGIHTLIEADAADEGNVTEKDPHNLIVGSDSGQTIHGTYRSDTILGRGGIDVIDDGDAPGDTVWADDILIGGGNDDTFKAGAGDDTIWGGDENDDTINGGGTDTVDYNAFTGGITIHFDGAGATPTITVSGASVGTDTLHSIELIKATEYSDRFEYIGVLPGNYALTVDLAGGIDSVGPYVDLGGADVGMHYQNGEIRNNEGDTSGVIHLQNLSTMISGTMYDDEITDEAEGDKHIYGGEGDDEITVGNGDAVIRGGLGDDRINGGDGDDILRGEWGTDIVHGGEGSDFLSSHRDGPDVLSEMMIEDAEKSTATKATSLSWLGLRDYFRPDTLPKLSGGVAYA